MNLFTANIIDINGFIIDVTVIDLDVFRQEENPFVISIPIPQSVDKHFFIPKWNGKEWTEGATQEEIDEITKVEPSLPTQEELMEQRLADLELMLVEILSI